MKTRILVLCLFLIGSISLQAQKYTISGYIEDASTGEKLIAANIFDLKSASGTVSNTYGFYSVTLPKDSIILSVSYIGYQTKELQLMLDKDIDLNIKLGAELELQTVEVVGEKFEKIEEETQMSRVDIPIEQIKKVPALLGETDVLKTLQLLPGVQSGGEGQNGLYVRGGSPDQNLILLDGVPVYNVSHVLGIFSVFNADAIKNVTLTKGGFPARYGGRLSSVLEINMKEGNSQEFHGEGSIGLISSKLTLEGPIIKDKTSFIVSGRRTYADVIAKPIIKSQNVAGEGASIDPTLYFYDLNAKINHKFNDNHRLYLSAYSGADVFQNVYTEQDFKASGGIDWGNLISALRWNYKITNKLFANTTLTYSKYDINILAGTEDNFNGINTVFSAKYKSGIEDLGGKIDFDFRPNPHHYIRFGAGATHHTYSPGALVLETSIDEIESDTTFGSTNATSLEYALYLEDDIQWGALKANIGVHTSAFSVDDQTYFSVQPRLGLRYLLPNNLALKGSFSTMTQFINLLTSEALSLPTDLWVPSTAKIKPQESWQVAAGVARTFWDNYEISLEGYYKQMDNVISFKEGASFLFDIGSDWQDKVTQGKGEAYGMEFFIQKKKGKTTGWIGYTLSWNNRQFDDINGGKVYPFRYDRRHDIAVVASHDFTDRLTATAAWIYGTGNAITLPIYTYPTSLDIYSYPGPDGQPIIETYSNEVQSLGQKNDFRMSDYHRLDIGIEWRKKRPKWESKWVFSVYNTYWHKNPYYVTATTDRTFENGVLVDSKRVFKEISILPIIPSISYGFKF